MVIKAKELIEHLERLVEKHGNLDLVDDANNAVILNFVYGFDEWSNPQEAFVLNNH